MNKRLLLISDSVGTATPARGILNYSAGMLACCKRLGVETTLVAETTVHDLRPTGAAEIARSLVEGRAEGSIRYQPRWKHLYVKYLKAPLSQSEPGQNDTLPIRAIVANDASVVAQRRKIAPHLAWLDAFMPVADLYSDSTLRASYGLPPQTIDARGFDMVVMDAFHYAWPVVDTGTRIALVIHDLILLDTLQGRYKRVLERKFKVSLERASELIFVSATTMDEFCQRFPEHAKRLPQFIFPPVIRPELFDAAQSQHPRPAAARPAFVSILSDEPRKNIALLVEAFGRMTDRADLVVIGNIQADKYLVGDAPTNVRFVGQVTDDEKAAHLRSASALVFPSLSEGFGIPIVEGALFGLPVICSDLPVFHEVTAGLATHFDPRSPADLVRRLDEFMSGSQDFQHKAKALHHHCVETYGVDASTIRLAKIFALKPA